MDSVDLDANAAVGESTGETAASRVQGIVDAAEATAAKIVSDAKAQADRHVQEAQQAAERIRAEALAASEEHLAAIEQATARLRSNVRSSSGASRDLDGARLVALNMALNGDPRETTDRYLAENFDLPERDKLLDEVYAAVDG